jgi:hypothetical protein
MYYKIIKKAINIFFERIVSGIGFGIGMSIGYNIVRTNLK